MRYRSEARADLDCIWRESATRFGANQADKLIESLTRKLLRTIERSSHAGRARPEFGAEIRSYSAVPYVAFYRVADGRVEVLRIVHGYRDVKEPLMSLLRAV